MKSEYKNHVKNIIGRFEMEEQDEFNEKVCFLKHYSGMSIEEEDVINIMASLNVEYDMLYYKFHASMIQGAFCPFLPFIREMYMKYYRNMGALEFVHQAGVYQAVEYLFYYYIETGTCKRIEDVIPREVKYEQERITDSIVSMIRYISNEHKLVIVLDSIQETQESTVLLLLSLMKSKGLNQIVIIGTYNEAHSVNAYMRDSWNLLVNHIKKSGLFIDCDDDQTDIEMNDIFIPEETDIKEYLKNIKDMYLCLTLNQAKYYLNIIYNAIETDNLEVSAEDRLDILNLYAVVTVMNREDKLAYVYCKKMYDTEQLHRDKERLYRYYYTYALISKQSGQIDAANEALDKGKELAAALGDKYKEVHIDMLRMIVILDKYPDILLWTLEDDMPEEILQEAVQYQQRLHLAYAYIYGFKIPDEEIITKGDLCYEEMPPNLKGIKIAEELDNTQLQIRAWQRIAIQIGIESKEFCYNKCLNIMSNYEHKHKEAQIYNGIGYSYLIIENYPLAFEYFRRALLIGIDTEAPKYILDSVYNMAITGINVGDYDAVVKYVTITLKMMTSLKLERLNVCNKTKLYGFIIFSYIKKKQIYNAKLYFEMMETALDHILSSDTPNYSMWEDDMYLYYAVKGMLCMEEQDYGQAADCFETLQKLWDIFESKQNYIVARVVEEEAKLYEITGDVSKREAILTETIAFCRNQKLIRNADRLEDILKGEQVHEFGKPEELSNDVIDKALEVIQKNEMRLEIEQKNKLLHFFETWVDLLDEEFESEEDMMNSAMLNIKNIFELDSILYIKMGKDNPVVGYSDGELELKKYQLKYIYSFFSEYKRRIIASRFQKSYQYHEELIAAFNREDIVSMVAIPFINKDSLTEVFIAFKFQKINYTENLDMLYEEEADVLRTAFRELIEAVNRENIKRQLEKTSVTDLLTGLYNRQGFGKCIVDEFAKLEEEQKDRKKMFTILYMDLDNFKYCNDNFGHDAGDAVLVAFSRMLEAIVEEKGFIVRYGGDEFLIVLPDGDIDKGVEMAEKIFANLKHNKGFKKVLEKIQGDEVEIEEKHRVTCSIGIASGNASNKMGITKILKKADEALYSVKKGTKHNYKIWENDLKQ